jgi:hypothetical protein
VKSKLFSVFDPKQETNKEFCGDVAFVSSTPEKAVLTIVKHTAAFGLAPTTFERRKVAELAATESELPPKDAARCLRMFYFIARNMLPGEDAEEDSAQALAADLMELGIILPEKAQFTENWLARVRDVAMSALSIAHRKSSSADTALPTLASIDVAVDFRGVFDHEFDALKEKVTSYSPKCIGVEPVAVFRLRLSHAPQENVCFQTDRRSLRLLQDYLTSAEKELEAVAKFLNLKVATGEPEHAQTN